MSALFRSWVLCGVLGALGVLGMQAALAEGEATYRFDLPEQALADSLRAIARVTGANVLFESKDLKGVKARELRGDWTMEGAVEKVLAGTRLKAQRTTANTVIVQAVGEVSEGQGDGSIRVAQAGGSGNSVGMADSGERAGSQLESGKQGNAGEKLEEVHVAIPEILVTGSKALNTDIRRSHDGTLPYIVFDKDQIQRSGAQNIEEFLKSRLTMGTAAVSNSQNQALNTSLINLRGLGTDETLILIDGRRAVSVQSGGSPIQPDLNGIPLSAIERIEVLPNTASGIYGGSATGGVVNVIMRHDYNGTELKVSYGNTFESDLATKRIDANSGFSLNDGKTNIMLAASWSDSGQLLAQDRDFATRLVRTALANNSNAIFGAATPPLGATTNVRSNLTVGGVVQPLTLRGSGISLGATRTFIPYGYSGVSSDNGAALIANAGKYNFDLPNSSQRLVSQVSYIGNRYALLNAPRTKSVSGTFKHQLTPWLDLFGEFSATKRTGTFSSTQTFAAIQVPAGAAGNPFNEPITIMTPTLGVDQDASSALTSLRGVSGLILRLPQQWSLGADYTWSRSRIQQLTPGSPNTAAATNAVSTGVLNVFRDTNALPVDFSPYVTSPINVLAADTTLGDVALRLSGPLRVSMLGGDPTLSMLLEHREERLADSYQSINPSLTFLFPNKSQAVDSMYAEMVLPIVSLKNVVQGVKLMELQLSGRHDIYETQSAAAVLMGANGAPVSPIVRSRNKFNSTDPTIGIRYQPISDLMFRASYGTGFLPPSMSQLLPNPTPSTSTFPLRDPLRGNEPLRAVSLMTGGNPSLGPESSKSSSAGLVLTPHILPDMRLSVDWTRIRKSDNISTFPATASQENFNTFLDFVPERITRGPASDGFNVGPITAINVSQMNFANFKVEALDIALDYQIGTQGLGKLFFSIGATRLLSLESQLFKTLPVIDYTGVGPAAGGSVSQSDSGGLKWKGIGTLDWSYGRLSAGWTVRYSDSYFLNPEHTFVLNQGSSKVSSQIYHDLFASCDLMPAGSKRGLFDGSKIQVGIVNIFNKSPPIDVLGTGFSNSQGYSYFGDPRLANYYVAIRKNFATSGR